MVKEEKESDILTQLKEAKQEAIESLKTRKKELLKPSLDQFKSEIIEQESSKISEINVQTPSIITENNLKTSISQVDSVVEDRKVSFLDFFGNLPIVHPDIVNKFRINTVNLVNSRVVNIDYLDLENLFYYISILRMLNIQSPFTPHELIELMKDYVNGEIFSSSRNVVSDPISNFYGLAILTESNLIVKADIINLSSIEEYLKSKLKSFRPDMLKLNYHALLCLLLLKRIELITLNKEHFLNPLLSLNLLNLKDFNPILDVFNQLALLKLIDSKLNLEQFRDPYINELKKALAPNGSISNLITDSARTLLIIDLLDLKDQESTLCGHLLNYVINSTVFFSLENPHRDFNWRIDKLAYKVELRMLFWALLACSRYKPLYLKLK